MSNATPTPSVSCNKLDPIAVLREELAAAAVCHGVERVDDLTEALLTRVVQRLGGVQVFVPARRIVQRWVVVGHSPATDSSMNVRKTGCAYSCVPMRKV